MEIHGWGCGFFCLEKEVLGGHHARKLWRDERSFDFHCLLFPSKFLVGDLIVNFLRLKEVGRMFLRLLTNKFSTPIPNPQ